jgi:hypothetical protein
VADLNRDSYVRKEKKKKIKSNKSAAALRAVSRLNNTSTTKEVIRLLFDLIKIRILFFVSIG